MQPPTSREDETANDAGQMDRTLGDDQLAYCQLTLNPLLKLNPPGQGLEVSRNQYW